MPQNDPWDEEAANIKKSGAPLAAATTASAPAGDDDYSIWNKTLSPSSGSGQGDWRDNLISGIKDPSMTPDPENTVAGRFERFGQRTASGLAQAALHPLDTAAAVLKPSTAGSPQEMQQSLQGDVDTVKDYVKHPENLAGDVAAGAITGHLLGGLSDAGGKAFGTKPPVAGQNYTPEHHQALSAVLARGTGMGKDFIAPDVATDIASPLRQAAADDPALVDAINKGEPKDALGATQKLLDGAKKQIDYLHAKALNPVAGTPVDMTPVQQAIPKARAFHPAADAAQLEDLRTRAGKVKTLGDLNDFRQYLNGENAQSFRQSAIAAGRGSVADEAYQNANTAARNHYYDQLEQATGLDFKGMKRTESSIMKAQEAMQNVTPSLVNKDALAHEAKGPLATAGDMIDTATRAGHGLPFVGYLAEKLRGTPLQQVQTGMQRALTDLPAPSAYRGPLTSRYGQPPKSLPANVPGNAPYGAPSQAGGSTGPAVPATAAAAPPAQPRLPATAGPEGQGVPPGRVITVQGTTQPPHGTIPLPPRAGQLQLGSGADNPEFVRPPASPPGPVNPATAQTNVNAGAPRPAQPIIPQRTFNVGPDGQVIQERPALPKPLDKKTAAEYYKRAGKDPEKARELARKDGYSF